MVEGNPRSRYQGKLTSAFSLVPADAVGRDDFETVIDPVGAGFVESMARPGGKATGFTNYEYSINGKWLELLKELAPRLSRVGVIRAIPP